MNTEQSKLQEALRPIESLHERDMEASRLGDFETLQSLLSDDAVMMPPGAPWIRGAKALEENYRQMAEAMREVEVVDYRLEFEEVQVVGDYVFEWGRIRGAELEELREIALRYDALVVFPAFHPSAAIVPLPGM